MTREAYLKFHRDFCDLMIAVTTAKNTDYCAGDDPFGNFKQIGQLIALPNAVEVGFLTRMSDKLSRIGSFITRGELQVRDESVQDTLHDLANYCALFSGYLESKKVRGDGRTTSN